MLDRSTFCFPDSDFEPTNFATSHRFDLLDLTDEFDAVERDDASEQELGRLLDDYIEAHVHGVITFADDVEGVILDPCYRSSDIEASARRLGVPVGWHDGRVLTVDELERHPNFRGPEAIRVGRQIARDGELNARVIGDAVRSRGHDPQTLKKVWHLVARFGVPAT
jgi:hypothetical protein